MPSSAKIFQMVEEPSWSVTDVVDKEVENEDSDCAFLWNTAGYRAGIEK